MVCAVISPVPEHVGGWAYTCCSGMSNTANNGVWSSSKSAKPRSESAISSACVWEKQEARIDASFYRLLVNTIAHTRQVQMEAML